VKKSKLAGGKPHVQKTDFADNHEAGSASNHDEPRGNDMYSDSDDDRLGQVGEDGVDLSELMDMDETPVTEPDSNRPTADHKLMLKTLQKGLGLDYAAQRAKAREDAKSIAPAKRENSFGVSAEGSSKVDLSDLMSFSGVSKDAKKGLEKLSRSDRRLAAEGTKEAKARMERGLQYEDSKALLSEWLPTVQTMRQSDSLVFPLPEQIPKREKVTTSNVTSSFTPQTELEKTVFGILEDSGVTEAKLQQAEDLATKRLSTEEIEARHRQIARLRSLFFYQEQKNKRNAKNKSKKYHRILKKAREKKELTLAELEELDPEAYKLELEKLDKARALERVGIKHSHLGKWAKHALRSKDPHTMQAVRDHLEHGRMLKKRMETDRDGSDVEDSDDGDFSEGGSLHSSDFDSENDALDQEGDENQAGEPGDIIDIHGNVVKTASRKRNAEEDPDASSGIFSMKFMQRASAKKQADHDELMSQMDHEIDQRRRKMKAQGKRAKDDFSGEGLRPESDSDASDTETKLTRGHIESSDEEHVQEMDMQTSRPGRKKVAASASQVAATAVATQYGHHYGEDADDDDDDFASSSMLLDAPQGFSASVKGRITVKTTRKVAQPTEGSDYEDESTTETTEPNGMAFKPNSKNVSAMLAAEAAKSKSVTAEKEAKLTKAQKKTLRQQKGATGAQLDENAVLIGSISTGVGLSSRPEQTGKSDAMKADNEETVIHVPRREMKSTVAEENPWMVVEEDDDGLVIPGTKSVASASSSKPKKQAKKIEDRVAVDLEQVQRRLKDEEAKHETVFNLSAAGATSKSQRELIERAFASDHLTEGELAAEKMESVTASNEVESEYAALTMPGWGEWAGKHVKPSVRRKRLLQEMHVKKEERSAQLMAERRDAKLKHAVISDKPNKRFAMYQTVSVPSEFKDNAQLYEASLRQPMGKEWNVRDAHAKLVKPKVVHIPGLVIEPIQKKREGIQRKQ
jgi:U3 small nucleolar RNA-associated protein 14